LPRGKIGVLLIPRSKEGGYLALIAPDGITVVSELNYLEQVQDISYGALGNNRSVGYLENPTPEAINSGLQADGPPAESVKFDQALLPWRFSLHLRLPRWLDIRLTAQFRTQHRAFTHLVLILQTPRQSEHESMKRVDCQVM